MRKYELMLILDSELDERSVESTVEKLLHVIPAEGGTVDNVDIWGRRRFAYEIQKKSEGYYVVIDFTATPDTTKELDRQLGINETVVRTKIVRPDAK
ncbi:small subunit ribosomal protein S6 [Brevibacterium paucivorans]|uniref:Small ribosomal subunit protein bS6 n=2 Tax=Actinomycetes TaxID=1760 RepID=A0A2N6VL05_9MICO|nr:30S ribosomal protein S6 [Brevibacterium paucivorans]MBM7816415.1 small subunit ribosomal protein S6 [Brevibacterium paucivorans]MCG7298032.1 30S ribosomal protein S6 [Brevibacterium sp. ACRRH]PMD04806.1 30S ribosomal protein S6 [Brevibacterium paucivorans]